MPAIPVGTQATVVDPIDDRKLFRMPLHELERRWSAVRAVMAAANLDAMVFWSRRDFHGGYVKWLTDAPAFNPRTVIFHQDALMTVVDHGPEGGHRVLDGNDPDWPGIGDIFTTASVPSVHYTQTAEGQIVSAVLGRHGARRVGWVNAAAMAHGLVGTVMEALQGSTEHVDATDAIDEIKALKSPVEIAEIRRACALQDHIFAEILPHMRPGMRDFEVSALARHIGESLGAEQALYLAGSAPQGSPAQFRNRHFQGRTIRPGDHLNLLIENNGPGGYYGELARTVVFGRACNELLDCFSLVLAAQADVAARLVPGAIIRDVALASDNRLVRHGYPAEDRLLAHGQGYDLVERPLIRTDETMPLTAGMCISVHPAVRSASLYMTICDNFLISKDGAERLHSTQQRLFEL